jgi:O-antigen ligase
MITVGLLEALYSFAQFSGYHLPYLKPDQANWLASGTFLNRNHLAGYLEMVIPLTCGVLFLCLGKSGPFPLKRLMALFDEQYLKALLILFLIGVMICALLLSGSRGGVLSFAASMIFLCLLAFMRRGLRKWALVVMMFLLLTLGVALLSSPERAVKRLDALTKPDTEQSFTYRKDVWKNSLLIWRDFPIFGSGLGSFAHIFRRYQGFVSDLFFAYAESDYVQLVVETGIVGTLLMFWLGILFFHRTIVAWKQRRSRWTMTMVAAGLSAVFSLCMHSGVDFNLHVPSNAVTFTVIAALSYVAAHTHSKSKR